MQAGVLALGDPAFREERVEDDDRGAPRAKEHSTWSENELQDAEHVGDTSWFSAHRRGGHKLIGGRPKSYENSSGQGRYYRSFSKKSSENVTLMTLSFDTVNYL